MIEERVVLVMLRRPRVDDKNETRTDPLWEFGSFGCTGCHRANLMNPNRLAELNGTRLAFAQNGPEGVKLVHLTPPIRILHHGSFGEAKWSPAKMPLSYRCAPTLVSNYEFSDFPLLNKMLVGVLRGSPVARFASKFRSRREPLPPSVGAQIISVYEESRKRGGRACLAQSYVDALPYAPPKVDHDRRATYEVLLQNSLFRAHSHVEKAPKRCARAPRRRTC
jgi:hypothetical protein